MSEPSASSAVVMFGKPVADAIDAQLLADVPKFIEKHKVVPTLAIVLVGDSRASQRYVQKKIEASARLHMKAELKAFPPEISADALKEEVSKIARSPQYHGVLVQLPLPAAIEEHETASAVNKFDVFDVIPEAKDVDGVGSTAVTALYRAQQDRMIMMPGTALAVRRIMAFYGVNPEGKRAVVVGRNDITSKPILMMLGGRMCNAAVSWCHRHVRFEDQVEMIRSADIVVTAVGNAKYRITRDMIKPGAAIFDVATRVDDAGKMHGDVDFEEAKKVAGYITPVPKGVGPVTVAALSENLFRAAKFAVGAGEPGYTF